MPPEQRAALRSLPSVDELVRALDSDHGDQGHARTGADATTHDVRVEAAREVLASARVAVQQGHAVPTRDMLLAHIQRSILARRRRALRHVINATGVIVNTNLGRAPVSAAALAALPDVASGYSNLEYDLEAGGRGSRHTHVRTLLRELIGAEDALVVNNNAAAVLVVLSALAAGREVIVSRGELVEIGGGFRVPDVMRQGGARLVEVGTTNRTRLGDYAAAITTETALLLAVHPSNFRVVGFTEAPELVALAALAHERGLSLVHDLGSGSLIASERWGLAHEPMVQESIAAGADVVTFSGDKLLGGPQAGIIVGREALLVAIARHPLMRAVRIDKLTLAVLEATLRQYRDGEAEQAIPVWQMIALPADDVRRRAEGWAEVLRGWGLAAMTVAGESTVGGGSLPGETLPTTLCAISSGQGQLNLETVAARLRTGEPAVLARISRDRLLLDPRTVRPGEDDALLAALRAAFGA
jgi:L-seryl-tRNA(Ser) seleniumtransferase